MLPEPLTPPYAKKLILNILKKGTVTYAEPHALQRMEERDISTLTASTSCEAARWRRRSTRMAVGVTGCTP